MNADEPEFTLSRDPPFGQMIVEGMQVSLRCLIESNPPAIAKWVRDPDPVAGGALRKARHPLNGSNLPLSLPRPANLRSSAPKPAPQELLTHRDGSIVFSSITVGDSGWYRCTTGTSLGTFSSFGYYLNIKSKENSLEYGSLSGGSTICKGAHLSTGHGHHHGGTSSGAPGSAISSAVIQFSSSSPFVLLLFLLITSLMNLILLSNPSSQSFLLS